MSPIVRVVLVAVVAAQVTGEPRFEVASIKPHRADDLMIRTDTEPGGRFLAVNVPLRTLLQLAYGVEDFAIAGAPDWAGAERFDVEARASQELPPLEGPTRGTPVLRQMLQALLRERFALRARTESREIDGLALTARPGQAGTRLTRSAVDCAALLAKAKPDDGPPACGFRMAPGSIVLEGVPISSIASALTGVLGRPVVDRSGLAGNFDLQLHWDPPIPGGPTPGGVTLATALGDQAGLRLEPARVAATVLVVEAVQRPSAN